MAEEEKPVQASYDDAVLQQQYLRALSSFEGIVLSQIDIKNKLGDRLNYSIRTGIIILGVIAFSILVLLLTLSSQVIRISDVVANMNDHFTSISVKMDQVKDHMIAMEGQVSLLNAIDGYTGVIDNEISTIARDMETMQVTVDAISQQLSAVRNNVGNISVSIDRMNLEVQAMGQEMHHMAKPARSMNQMFPFP